MRAFVYVLGILIVFAGCAGPPREGTDGSKPERYSVTEAALRYELGKASTLPGESDAYSGYILDCGEFTEELLASFRGFRPPVIADALMVSDASGEEPLDKSTGKHIKVWSVDIKEFRRNFAKVYVFWSSGGPKLGGGGYTLELRQKKGQWRVVSEKLGCVP